MGTLTLTPDEYRDIFESHALTLVEEGLFNLAVTPIEQLLATISDKLSGTPARDNPLHVSERLLVLAESEFEQAALRCVFYAMWCEHQLNKMTVALGRHRTINDDVIQGIIRRASAEDKMTWVLQLFGHPPSDAETVKTARRLMELRN